MAAAVIMPKAGITVEFCIIGQWLKKPGDRVELGDVLFSYETDKATFECESTAAGTLLECFYQDGDEVPCLVNVCAIGNPGEDVSDLRPDKIPAPAAELRTEAPAATPAPPVAGDGDRDWSGISPRARDLAARAGVDPALAVPTGPKGRIIERDVRTLLKDGPAPAPEASVPAQVRESAASSEFEDVKFSGIRRAIAKTMHQSLSTMAQLTHQHSFDAAQILEYRKKLKEAGGVYGGVTLGDILLYAVSRTLKNHPDLNANLLEENVLRRFRHVNLGVAVNTDRGLMVPTVFHADALSLLELSGEVKRLAGLCRSGAVSPDLLQGGSFTVSNLGALGVEAFTPVINPPQTGILGVCAVIQRPRACGGGIELYPAMGLSLSYDHRAVDGAPAAAFMSELCANLERFTALLAL